MLLPQNRPRPRQRLTYYFLGPAWGDKAAFIQTPHLTEDSGNKRDEIHRKQVRPAKCTLGTFKLKISQSKMATKLDDIYIIVKKKKDVYID